MSQFIDLVLESAMKQLQVRAILVIPQHQKVFFMTNKVAVIEVLHPVKTINPLSSKVESKEKKVWRRFTHLR